VLVIQNVLRIRRVGAVRSDVSNVFSITNGDGICRFGPHMIYYKCCIECDIFHCPGVYYWDGSIVVYGE